MDNVLNVDAGEIRRALDLLFEPGDVVELRLLKVCQPGSKVALTRCGYFDDFQKLVAEVEVYNFCSEGVYVTLNRLDPALIARSENHSRPVQAGEATSDRDVQRLRWLLVDVDPRRPRGISATAQEHDLALFRAIQIKEWLATLGLPWPIFADSGNGGHLLFAIDLPPEDAALLKGVLAAISFRFDDQSVQVDTSTYNPSRISKLYGSVARKGESTDARPHRLAHIEEVPEVFSVVPREALEAVARMVPQVANPPRGKSRKVSGNFDLGKWIEQYVPGAIGPAPWQDGKCWVLPECPFNAEHRDRSAYIVQLAAGGIAAGCHHESCANKGWRELRAIFEKTLRPEPGKNQKADPDKIGITKRLADAITGLEHFAVDAGGKLYRYHRGVYKPDGARIVAAQAKSLLEEWELTSEWSTYRVDQVTAYIGVDAPRLWERPPAETVNLANGLLDWGTRTLRPHSPEFLSTVQLPVTYDPTATCPAWEKFCAEVFPEDCITTPFEIVALVMVPLSSIQKAILLMGPGGNGKSVFLSALTAFVGKRNISNLSLHRLESDRFAAARLMGRLGNSCADLPSGHLEGTSVFKAVTGGDAIAAEYKFHDGFDYTPFVRLVFSANSPPRSPDDSEAFFDRWIVVPFNNIFRGAEREIPRAVLDATLADPAELSGVLNRCLDVLPGLVDRNGVVETPTMKGARDDFRQRTDHFSVWLDQHVVADPSEYVFRADLFMTYNMARARDGMPLKSEGGLGRDFKRLRPTVEAHQVPGPVSGERKWAFRGIKIIDNGLESGLMQ